MDYQILVNISVGIITLMGGWVFKMILGHINEIKEEQYKNAHSGIASIVGGDPKYGK